MLARFYGWSDEDIDAMSLQDANAYLQASEALRARELLDSMTTSSFPNMKKSAREKIHRSTHKLAFPSIHDEANENVVTSEDAFKIMSSRLANGTR